MDQTLRSRLVAMAAEYHGSVAEIIGDHRALAAGKAEADTVKTNVTAELAREWAKPENKSNEQVRNAQLGQALLAHARYQQLLAQARSLEESIAAGRMQLEALRFEQATLIAVVNNDDRPISALSA